MSCPLERSRRDPVFLSQPSPTLLLSRDYTIKAATRSYLASSGRPEEALLSFNVFDAFPANPATPQCEATRDFTASVERVLSTRRPHQVTALRYDVEDRRRPGEFVEKRWVLVNTPVRAGDDVVGVMVRVDDITVVDQTLVKALRGYRDAVTHAELPAGCSRAEAARALLTIIESYQSLSAEVDNLRRALRSRPTIEQAKGIVMADRRCTAEEAFDVLRRLSMETNVKLADVAAALTYQLRSPDQEDEAGSPAGG